MIDYNSGNPDGVLQEGEEPRAAERAARGDLPGGGHALLRQPALRARRRVGVDDDEAAGAEQFIDFVAAPREPGADPPVRLPAREPGRVDRQPRSTTATASTPTSPRRCSRCPSPRCSRSSSTTGRTSASRPACCCSIDVSGSMSERRRPRDRRHQARPGQAGHHHRARRVQRRRRGRASGCSPPTSAPPTTRRAVPRAGPHRPDRRRARAPQGRRSATWCPLNGTPLYRATAGRLRARSSTSTTPRGSTRWCCSPTA